MLSRIKTYSSAVLIAISTVVLLGSLPVSAAEQNFTYSFQQGYNQIALYEAPAGPLTFEYFFRANELITEMCSWETTQQWKCYKRGDSAATATTLTQYKAYRVKSDAKDAIFSYAYTKISSPAVTFNFIKGDNYFGLSSSAFSYTAYGVLKEIPTATAVIRFNPITQLSEQAIKTSDGQIMGTDFNIATSEGYGVTLSEDSVWKPVIVATKSAEVALTYDASSPASQNIKQGAQKAALVNYQINVNNGHFELPSFRLSIDTSKAKASNVSTLYVYKSGVMVGKVAVDANGDADISLPIIIPNGETQIWEIKGDISSTAVVGDKISLSLTRLAFPNQPEFSFTKMPIGMSNEMTVVANETVTNYPPVITGVSGPTSLKVNETGTWSLMASDSDCDYGIVGYGSCFTITVNWGDGTTPDSIGSPPPSSFPVPFSHSYSKIGAYTITFTVTDDKGASAKASITVQIQKSETSYIFNLQAPYQDIRPTSAVIKWNTKYPSKNLVYYTEYYDISNSFSWEGTDDLSTDHTITLKNLKPFTSYKFYVNAYDENGKSVQSGMENFTTTIQSEETDLVISNVQSAVKGTEVIITWNTNIPSNSEVYFYYPKEGQKEYENWSFDGIDNYTTTLHKEVIEETTGLKENTTYYYIVSSRKAPYPSTKVSSEVYSFTTGKKIIQVIPSITSISPTSGPVGTKLTIYGKNLQDDCGKREERVCQLTVSIGGHEIKRNRFVELKVTWAQDRIFLVVPPQARTGAVRIVRNDGDKSYDISGPVFTVRSLGGYTIEPEPGTTDSSSGNGSAPSTTATKAPSATEIRETAQALHADNIDELLAEIKLLRNTVREQETRIKYLEKLTSGTQELSQKTEDQLNTFIAYGVDENTKRLGEGERAAVLYSFKSAFNKLPETEDELNDAILVANGHWPKAQSEEAEARAQTSFKKIYRREANLENPNDSAAVMIMAYGLKQQAQNRNLKSEGRAIATFRAVYKRTPTSTEDWNVVQATAYSGTRRK